MIDQHEIKEPHSIQAFRSDLPEQSQLGDKGDRSEERHTEIKIITHTDELEALEQDWNGLARESDTHIFQTYEWNRIWWQHFGANKKLHIVAVYTENKLAGIAPLFEDDVHLFGRKVYSCLRFLGSYVSQPEGEPLIGNISYSDYLDCIIQPGYEQLFYRYILQHFEELKSEYDEIILDEVSEESVMSSIMIPLIEGSNFELSYKIEPASSSPVIQLDSTWKAYLNSLNVKDRYNARRYFKRSKKGNAKAFKIEKIKHPGELPGVLTDLIQMHQQQWNSRGFAGTFSEKRMCDFLMEISKSFYEHGWIEFNMAIPAEAGAKYVAIDAFLTYKNRVYLMHRGMDEDSLYRKQGPGNVLLFARLNEAIHDGVKVFDMLRGSEEFKIRMATKINQNKKIIVYTGNKAERLLPALVNKYMWSIRQARIEKIQVMQVFKGKSFFKAITEYTQFLHRRIKHKFYH